MIVYLDIIFIENILMNYIILYACGVILKIKLKKWKIFLSASFGATYTIIMYLNIVEIYSNTIMKFILSIVMVYVAFKPDKVKKMLKELTLFYLTSFVFGGCVFGLMYFLKPQMVQIRNGVFVGTYPMKIAIIGGSVAFIIMQISFKLIKNKVTKKDIIYTLKIRFYEKEKNINALLDTGNLLKEPITGFPVVITEKKALKGLIPEIILNNINKIVGGDTDEINSNNELAKYISRFRMIPFSSVGKQNGLLLGIRCDSVSIEIDGIAETKTNVIIGIYDKSFTKNDSYSAIFGLDIIEGGNVNENVSNVKV